MGRKSCLDGSIRDPVGEFDNAIESLGRQLPGLRDHAPWHVDRCGRVAHGEPIGFLRAEGEAWPGDVEALQLQSESAAISCSTTMSPTAIGVEEGSLGDGAELAVDQPAGLGMEPGRR